MRRRHLCNFHVNRMVSIIIFWPFVRFWLCGCCRCSPMTASNRSCLFVARTLTFGICLLLHSQSAFGSFDLNWQTYVNATPRTNRLEIDAGDCHCLFCSLNQNKTETTKESNSSVASSSLHPSLCTNTSETEFDEAFSFA